MSAEETATKVARAKLLVGIAIYRLLLLPARLLIWIRAIPAMTVNAIVWTISRVRGAPLHDAMMDYARMRARLRYAWAIPLQRFNSRGKISTVPGVELLGNDHRTAVDEYWADHTVWGAAILTEKRSLEYLHALNNDRAFKAEHCGLYTEHIGEVIMEYGCGPGNDLVGWALESQAQRIIGVDISRKTLELARHRLALHTLDHDRLRFLQISDSSTHIPLPDHHVDYFNSLGVIHHTSDPVGVLTEIRRVLKPGASGRVMVYGAESVWINLHFGYLRMIEQGEFGVMSAIEAFQHTADLGAPIACAYTVTDFEQLCREAGFEVAFLGGYFMPGESDLWRDYAQLARSHPATGDQLLSWLDSVELDGQGYPLVNGKTAGLGSTFRLDNPVH